MIRIGEIDHVVFRVIDLQAMEQFYCGVLGCTMERRDTGPGLTQLRAGSSLIDLVRVDSKLGHRDGAAPGEQGHNVDHVCLRVENFDQEAILAHLRKHNVRIGEIAKRHGAEGDGPSIYIYDPQGNRLELKGPAQWDDQASGT